MDCMGLVEGGEGRVCAHVVCGGGEEDGGEVAAMGDCEGGVEGVNSGRKRRRRGGGPKPMHQSRFRSTL